MNGEYVVGVPLQRPMRRFFFLLLFLSFSFSFSFFHFFILFLGWVFGSLLVLVFC